MNRRNLLSLGLAAAALGGLAGCKPETLMQHAEAIADRLAPQILAAIDPSKPIIVSTLVSIDDLDASSTFGRTLSELVSSLLARRGILIADVRLRNALATRPSGELMLTRDAAALSKSHGAQAVLVGTYSVMSPTVYVSQKLVRVSDNRVLASTEAELTHEA